MKLIKISNERIVDLDTVTEYYLRRYEKDGKPAYKLYATQTSGEGLEFAEKESLVLWGYLETNVVGYGQ